MTYNVFGGMLSLPQSINISSMATHRVWRVSILTFWSFTWNDLPNTRSVTDPANFTKPLKSHYFSLVLPVVNAVFYICCNVLFLFLFH